MTVDERGKAHYFEVGGVERPGFVTQKALPVRYDELAAVPID